jgi:hypothetical protein
MASETEHNEKFRKEADDLAKEVIKDIGEAKKKYYEEGYREGIKTFEEGLLKALESYGHGVREGLADEAGRLKHGHEHTRITTVSSAGYETEAYLEYSRRLGNLEDKMLKFMAHVDDEVSQKVSANTTYIIAQLKERESRVAEIEKKMLEKLDAEVKMLKKESEELSKPEQQLQEMETRFVEKIDYELSEIKNLFKEEEQRVSSVGDRLASIEDRLTSIESAGQQASSLSQETKTALENELYEKLFYAFYDEFGSKTSNARKKAERAIRLMKKEKRKRELADEELSKKSRKEIKRVRRKVRAVEEKPTVSKSVYKRSVSSLKKEVEEVGDKLKKKKRGGRKKATIKVGAKTANRAKTVGKKKVTKGGKKGGVVKKVTKTVRAVKPKKGASTSNASKQAVETKTVTETKTVEVKQQ